MMKLDKDLVAIQEVRNLIKRAKEAQQELEQYSQAEIDNIVKAMAEESVGAAESLAQAALEETGIGVYEHKIVKNLFAAKSVYNRIKDMKTVGIIRVDEAKKVSEIAAPVGVIAALIPTTNPTSTTIFKALIALKARNAVVFSPHPRAVKCISQTVEMLQKAAVKAGAPDGIISCITEPTLEATNLLMTHQDVNVILATGGSGMVHAAYSSGKPAFGVGPGNVPAYIEKSAHVKKAVEAIMLSKSFDNGIICASEQSVICEKSLTQEVKQCFTEKGGAFLTPEDIPKLEKVLFKPNGGVDPEIVGKPAVYIAEQAGIKVPADTKVLLAELPGVGKEYPLSREKLSPTLAFYEVEGWQEACELAKKLLILEGTGHTIALHSQDTEVITKFALEKPASRIVVNTPSALGGLGATTGLMPSLTLGCGTFGGNSTSDNIGPQHLLNIKRLAYETQNAEEMEQELFAKKEATGKFKDTQLINEIISEVLKKLA